MLTRFYCHAQSVQNHVYIPGLSECLAWPESCTSGRMGQHLGPDPNRSRFWTPKFGLILSLEFEEPWPEHRFSSTRGSRSESTLCVIRAGGVVAGASSERRDVFGGVELLQKRDVPGE
ncbi:hypothetical protein WMY93_010196 [Mugilogobius chulae]|uniref:Uncharacterized protein n=1 Tax=Mugilogobius chulae TaxID=88201 RepID=A0AAW0PAE0_9GOBI